MYKLARYIFPVLLLLVIGYDGFGQLRPVIRRPPNFQQRVIRGQAVQRVEIVKENYIGRRLNLTPEQAARFWPVYRRYQEAITAVRIKKRLNNTSATTDGAQQIRDELYYEEELVNIRKYYTDEFLKIVPPAKVSEMFKAEREFTDELIKQLRERRQAATGAAPTN